MSLGVVAASVVALVLTGSAGAAPAKPGKPSLVIGTTDVAIVDIAPHQVWGNHAINPHATGSVEVIGGSTTVPTNATTVRLSVTVHGPSDGFVLFFPAGNQAGGAGHAFGWTAGQTTTQVTAENVGLKNMVSVFNGSTGRAIVTMKVTGYSTQVTSGDIAGTGGNAGDVLTDDGAGGALWRPSSTALGSTVPPGNVVALPVATTVQVTSLAVAAGSYFVDFTGNLFGNNLSEGECLVRAPSNAIIASNTADVDGSIGLGNASLAMQGLLQTGAGTIKVMCRADGNPALMYAPRLTMVSVGRVLGNYATRSPHMMNGPRH